MIPLQNLLNNSAIIDRIAREMYDDFRQELLIFSGDSDRFLLPWEHEGNEHQRNAYKHYAVSLCKALDRLNKGESPRSTPPALLEFDKRAKANLPGCCGN